MSHEFEIKRVEDKLKELRKEQEHITHNLMRTRRDEEYDLDRVRREYITRINAMEARQIAIEKEVKDRVRELERLERYQRQEEEQQAEEEREARENRMRQRLR